MICLQQSHFITKCVTLILKRALITVFACCLASIFLLSACGSSGDQEIPKSRKFTIAVENQSMEPVRLRFDALFTGSCQKGHEREIVPSKTSRVLDIRFEGCVNNGGDRIEGVVYEFFPADGSIKENAEKIDGQVINGSKIICGNSNCTLLTH